MSTPVEDPDSQTVPQEGNAVLPLRLTVLLTFTEVLALNRWSRELRIKGWIAIALGLLFVLSPFIFWMCGIDFDLEWDLVIAKWGGVWILLGLLTPTIAGIGAWFLKRPT